MEKYLLIVDISDRKQLGNGLNIRQYSSMLIFKSLLWTMSRFVTLQNDVQYHVFTKQKHEQKEEIRMPSV